MTEPTDHRTEAEFHLAAAGNTEDDQRALTSALIGIGYALLAQARPGGGYTVVVPPTPTHDMRCKATTDDGRRCLLFAAHDNLAHSYAVTR